MIKDDVSKHKRNRESITDFSDRKLHSRMKMALWIQTDVTPIHLWPMGNRASVVVMATTKTTNIFIKPLLHYIITGDPLHSRALAHSRAPLLIQPYPHCSHSRAPGEQWARLCVFTLQGCVQAARLCGGSPVIIQQATGLDAWASRVKCPARFVSHLHEIFIYIWVVYSFCLFCCLFIIVTWWYMWCIVWQVASKRKYRHVW